MIQIKNASASSRGSAEKINHWPAAWNLTLGQRTVLTTNDSADKLKAMFRSGKGADGSKVAVMHFETLREINNTDVTALHTY